MPVKIIYNYIPLLLSQEKNEEQKYSNKWKKVHKEDLKNEANFVKQTRVISGELEKARRDVTRPLF
jgi:hypothetical protein